MVNLEDVDGSWLESSLTSLIILTDHNEVIMKMSWRSDLIWPRYWGVLPGNTFGVIRQTDITHYSNLIYLDALDETLWCLFDSFFICQNYLGSWLNNVILCQNCTTHAKPKPKNKLGTGMLYCALSILSNLCSPVCYLLLQLLDSQP